MVESPQYERLEIESDQPVVSQRSRNQLLSWAAGAFTLLLFVATVSFFVGPSHQSDALEVRPDDTPADKRGAGLLLTSGSELLLLLRNSSHNNNTWGLPGGNVENSDTDLLDTAKREAQEEMGALPAATFQNQILTKRGKHGKKHYTVFIGRMTPEAKQSFVPHLNHEHRQWRWFDLDEALRRDDLHPVVKLMFSTTHRQQVKDAMSAP